MVKKGGLHEFEVIDLMEWFMKSMLELLDGMDKVMKSDDSSVEWPTYQTLKQLFNDITEPIEQLVVHLYPLPPYQIMRYNF